MNFTLTDYDNEDNPIQVDIECTVTEERDPLCTKDSPTEYEVEITGSYAWQVKEKNSRYTCIHYHHWDLSDKALERAQSKAIEMYRNSYNEE